MSPTRCPSTAFLTTAALTLAFGASAVFAQSALETPAPSPKARAEQRVGITDFAIDYSSPGVKGRPIWGALVPYNQLWRTGANSATKLTASRDFSFGGKAVPAGSYSIFTIPTSSSWTVILNSDWEQGGTDSYDEKKDVARITVTPEPLPAARERMTFLYSDTTDSSANLDLEWEKLRVRIPLAVDTKAQVMKGIDSSLSDAWRPHFMAARYLLDSGGDLNQALAYINTSIGIQPGWWNNWIKAQVLAKLGKKSEAITVAQQSQNLGKGNETYAFFSAQIAKAIEDWKK
ncbi:MAG: DUF2911 domain-containing protein [Acidobacteriota bacterium]